MKGRLSRDEEGRRRGLREGGLSNPGQTERDGGGGADQVQVGLAGDEGCS